MARTLASAAVLSLVIASAKSQETSSLWDHAINLRGSFGYKDNILLSNFQEESSAFWQAGADFLLYRIGEDDSTLNFSLSGNDRRYFSAPTVRKEQDASFLFSWTQPFKSDWETGIEASYFYLDQVMDASIDEFLIGSLQVKTHVLSFEPFLQYNLPNNWFLRFAPQVERNWVDVLDNYTEWGPELMAGKRYGHRSRATLSYSYHFRNYDSREQVMLDYTQVPGTSLVYYQHEVDGRIVHNWDEKRLWRSRFRVGFERNQDNGFGFFDYNKYRISKSFGYYGSSWNIVTEGKILHYDYDEQPAAGPGTESWNRREYLLSFRVEKMFFSRLRLFFESEHEWSRSNDPASEYQVNTVMGGVDWEF